MLTACGCPDHGEVVELDGDTLVLGGEEAVSVVLRLAPWRARSVLGCWRGGQRSFGCSPGASADPD
jgi:hypothetical protein